MRIEPRLPPEALFDLGDLPPLLVRLYVVRGVYYAGGLDKDLTRLISFQQLRGTEESMALLVEALEGGRRILIVGDFGADGATASSVDALALRMLGTAWVDYLVLNRFEYGYSLTPGTVDMALEKRPDLLVTVDNGISSVDGAQAAEAAGFEVLVTSHHLPGPELPAVNVIINPSQPGCELPSKAMTGVGMIFYMMLALRACLRELDWFAWHGLKEPNLVELLDPVALGSAADVVSSDANSHILIHQDLTHIRADRARPGLHVPLEVVGRPPVRITSTDLGFVPSPRLNAAGRLDDISLDIECLLCDNEVLARNMAVQLDQLNQDRKAIEQGMQCKTLAQPKEPSLEQLSFDLYLLDTDWHQGVIGIFVSHLRERYRRPITAFADTGSGSLKGSARPVPNFHIRDALDAVTARHPGLIDKFGNHAMAVGLSLSQENLGALSAAFDAEVRRQLAEEDLAGCLLSDGQLSIQEFHLELARASHQTGPWGQHFPEPMFHGMPQLMQQQIVGKRHLKLMLKSECGSLQLDGIAFNINCKQWSNPTAYWAELVYKLDVNKFRGQENMQLTIVHMAPH